MYKKYTHKVYKTGGYIQSVQHRKYEKFTKPKCRSVHILRASPRWPLISRQSSSPCWPGKVSFLSSSTKIKMFIFQTGRQEAKNAGAKSNLCCYRQGDFIHRLFRNHSYLPSGTETDKETPNAAPRSVSACRHHPAYHNDPYDQLLHALGVTSHIATYPWFTFSNQNTPHHKATKLHGIESTKFCYETTIVSITHKHSKIPH